MAQQTDYILRIIEQLGAALRRARDLLARDTPNAAESLQELDAAEDELLGSRAAVLRQLDAATVVSLLSDERAVELWIDLLETRATALRMLDRLDEATVLEARVTQLRAASRPTMGADSGG